MNRNHKLSIYLCVIISIKCCLGNYECCILHRSVGIKNLKFAMWNMNEGFDSSGYENYHLYSQGLAENMLFYSAKVRGHSKNVNFYQLVM